MWSVVVDKSSHLLHELGLLFLKGYKLRKAEMVYLGTPQGGMTYGYWYLEL